MRTALLKWRRALPWVLCACLAAGCAAAAYTRAREQTRYQAVYTLYAMPDIAGTQKAPLEAARMLARDCHALTRTDAFRQAALAHARSDGKTRVGVRGVDGTHMLEVLAVGPDRAVSEGLANAAGRELLLRARDTLGASDTREIAPASAVRMPAQWPLAALWALLITFAAGSALGCALASSRRPLHFDGEKAQALPVPTMGALADCRREVRRCLSAKGAQRGGMLADQADRRLRENVRAIALRLRGAMCAGGLRTAVIAGADADDGQAALAALLCGELARQGFRVLAVEADAAGGRLAPLLGAHPQGCLADYLAGRAALTDVMARTPDHGLAFLNALPPDGEVAHIAALPAFLGFLKSAESHYDFIILNAASVRGCADAGMLGALGGATVLAVSDGRYTAEELSKIIRELGRDVSLLAGVTFTSVRRSRMPD